MIEKIVPIPPEFYDDHKDEDLITSKGTIFPFAVFLYFMQWAAFLGFVLFYWYHPSSQVTQSRLENEWNYGRHARWNCTPMLNDGFYRSRYNHDTCTELMLKPKAEDIKSLTLNVDPACRSTEDTTCENATAFRFMPFKGMEGLGGKRGVVQPGSLIDNTYDKTDTTGIEAELEKIFAPLKELNKCGSIGFHYKNKGGWGKSKVDKTASFDIFVDQMKKKPPAPPPPPPASSGSGGGMSMPGPHGGRRLHFNIMDMMSGSDMGDQTEVSGDGAGCGDGIPTNPDGSCDYSSAPTLGDGMFYAPGGGSLSLDDLAEYGFDTSDGAEFEVCSITKEEALKMFEKYLTTHDPCVWAKHNAPFMCTKQGPPAPSAVFSLAYANALLAYSIFSAVCVQVFFASSKKKKKDVEETPAAGGGKETPATAV